MSLPPESDFFGRIVFLLQRYGGSYLRGAWVTMVIALISTFIGCVIGFAAGILQTIPADRRRAPARFWLLRVVRLLLDVYVEVFRGTPMMVQAMFIFYGAASLFGINMDMWTAALLIVSVNTGAYMAETVRGGILSIDPGQTEGAKALGMTHFQTMTCVVLPQALRNILPQIGNNLIINIKDTCVLSVIGVVELFSAAKGVAGVYYTFFESFAITMVIYFVLTFACSRLLRLWEKRLDGPESYDLVLADGLVQGEGMYRYPKNPAQPNADLRARQLWDAQRDARGGAADEAEGERGRGE